MTTPAPEPTPAAPKASPRGRSIAAAAEREFAAAEHLLAQHKLGHIPHPHLARRAAAGPVTTADQLPHGGALARLNTRVGVAITKAVGTMWCAYVFAALALISLPSAIRGGTSTMVSWTAQTLLQLVLLSIIMVGQNVQSAAGDARARATFDDGEAILHYVDGHAKNITELRAELEQGLAHVHSKLDAMHKTVLRAAAHPIVVESTAQAATSTAAAPPPASAVNVNPPGNPPLLDEHTTAELAKQLGEHLGKLAAGGTVVVTAAATAPPTTSPPPAAPAQPLPADGPAGSASTS